MEQHQWLLLMTTAYAMMVLPSHMHTSSASVVRKFSILKLWRCHATQVRLAKASELTTLNFTTKEFVLSALKRWTRKKKLTKSSISKVAKTCAHQQPRAVRKVKLAKKRESDTHSNTLLVLVKMGSIIYHRHQIIKSWGTSCHLSDFLRSKLPVHSVVFRTCLK